MVAMPANFNTLLDPLSWLFTVPMGVPYTCNLKVWQAESMNQEINA